MTARADMKLAESVNAMWQQLRARMRRNTEDACAVDPDVAQPVPEFDSLATSDEMQLVTGLNWELRQHTAVMGRTSPELHLGDRVATGPTAVVDAPSLLVTLADALVSQGNVTLGRWLFVARHGNGFWTALADIDPASEFPIRPVPGPERLHDTAAEAGRAIREEAEIATLAGIVLGETPAGYPSALEDDLRRSAMNILKIAPSRSPDLPVFTPATGLPLKKIGLGVLALGGGTALFTLALPLVMDALKPPPPPPPAMVAVAPAPTAFGETCTQTLSGWWPRVAGWTLVETGCALVGHLPANRADLQPEPGAPLTVPVMIWREIRQSGRVNAVLATGAAERMLRNWNHGSRQNGISLVLSRQVDIPLLRQDGLPASATDADQAIRMLA